MRYYFNHIEFSKRIKTKRIVDLDVELREASKKAKVSAATLSRLENGTTPEMETFLKVCFWLDALPREFMTTVPIKLKSPNTTKK